MVTAGMTAKHPNCTNESHERDFWEVRRGYDAERKGGLPKRGQKTPQAVHMPDYAA
jgi:hypothetical protein